MSTLREISDQIERQRFDEPLIVESGNPEKTNDYAYITVIIVLAAIIVYLLYNKPSHTVEVITKELPQKVKIVKVDVLPEEQAVLDLANR